jgi:dynein heavy chain
MYLENIFSAEDIQKQLPNESKLFQKVDRFWKDIMTKTHRTPSILDTCASDGLLRRFQANNKMLDEIQKCLNDYLETKRSSFPRFYFLSNDELLQILSQTRNPQAVQPHLRKCFDNMSSIVFTEGKKSKSIIAMISADNERVEFSDTVLAEGNVEFWLSNIEKMMVKSLYDQNKKAWQDYPDDALERRDWFFNNPAQLVLAVDQIYWSTGCTSAIEEIEKGKNKKALEEWLDFSILQINKMVEIVRSNLNEHERTLMGALIVLDVHAREVVRRMIQVKVNNVNNFEWSKQLRYYWEVEEDDCFVKQTNTRFRYGYEFLGNGPRLVITPLTDKCYMTLTSALHLHYGGNPQGPAGTGKTESTKDLAKALAIQCVVFNCSDGLDFRMMGRFFSGLAQSGAWSCFDEFNRIDIEVLSVIAQQMLTIQTAVKQFKDKFFFIDQEIPLNRRFGVFITMNPGYAGRTELPDNLKALFRPVSMMIPDYGLIAEIILFSEGFTTAFDLARKMVQLYKLSSEQLSKQKHYDFGMRAVKSVLVMAGALRRKDPESEENIVLIRAMRDSNVPKFLEHDLPLFEGIITDLFPGVNVPFVDYGNVKTKIENNLLKRKYQLAPKLVGKTIQLLETMLVRHGNMIVGEASTGKTTILEVLADALIDLNLEGSREKMHYPVEQMRLNPKAVTRGELFGFTNLLTNEWTDGLVSRLVNDAVESEKPDHLKWIIFDGPVDALWIENMNTVLDDNKTLCLTNGQRIKLPSTVTMIFEVMDLKVASPATVSRCGMVYMEPVHLGWEPLVETWKTKMKTADPDCSIYYDQACKIIQQVFAKGLPYIREECREIIPSVDNNLVSSCLKLLESVMDPESNKVDLKRAVSPEKT